MFQNLSWRVQIELGRARSFPPASLLLLTWVGSAGRGAPEGSAETQAPNEKVRPPLYLTQRIN
jgi:hypothetical protein